MAPKKRTPPGRIGRRSWESVAAASFDAPSDNQNPVDPQGLIRRRAGFARDMVFAEFGYRAGRAIDYDGFVDRAPSQSSATTWWRAPT